MVALGEPFAVGAEDQAVVAIRRFGQPQQCLQQALHMRRLEQVGPAHHFGDALRRIVDDDGEVIADALFLAPDDDVAAGERVGDLCARQRIGPAERPGQREGGGDVEPPGMGFGCHARGALGVTEVAAGAGIDDAARAVRGTGGGGDIGAAAEARIFETHGAQPVERRVVHRAACRLAHDRPVPIDAEPCQVIVDRRLEFGAAARVVDVLDAQAELAAGLPRPPPAGERRKGVAEVEVAGRRRGEAGDAHGAQPKDPPHVWGGGPRRSFSGVVEGERPCARLLLAGRPREGAGPLHHPPDEGGRSPSPEAGRIKKNLNAVLSFA